MVILMAKKVSIIIPTYQRSDRIERAVISALNQQYEKFEVIVVDDNVKNSDEKHLTLKNLEKFMDDSRFIFISHEDNKNGSVARNTGIKASTGEYITFLDDDDEYYPNKIRLQAEALENLPDEWAICYTGYDKIDQFGKKQVGQENSEGNVLIQALTKNLFLGSGSNFMVRRKVVEEINGFDENFKRNQDLEFLVRILRKYKIKNISKSTFLIHNEIRERKFSYEELIKINQHYKENFSDFINELQTSDKIEVEKTLDLWDVRYALTYKRFKELLNIYFNSKLNLLDLTKYFGYLIKRSITKKSYGFKLD